MTKLSWLKIKEQGTNNIYIYLKPSFFIDEKEVEERAIEYKGIEEDKQNIEINC